MGKVIPLKRKRGLTAPAALKRLRETSKEGVVEVPSYTALAGLLGWDRAKTWKAVDRWAKAGKVIIEANPTEHDKLMLRIPPDKRRLERGMGTGVAAPKKGTGKRKRGTQTAPAGVAASVPKNASESVPARASKAVPESIPTGTQNDVPHGDGKIADIVARRRGKSKTYATTISADTAAKVAPYVVSVSAKNTSHRNAENTSADNAFIGPPEAPPAAPSDTPNLQENSMGFFSRKAPSKPTAETPPKSPEPVGEVPTGTVPQKAEASVPKPYAERPRWRLWRRSGHAVERPAEPKPATVTVMPPARKVGRSYFLYLVAIGFLTLSMSINIWNARSYSGDWMDMAIPGGTGILAELVSPAF